MMAVGLLLVVIVPRVPDLVGKALISMGALVWIGGCFYILVIPGWQPGSTRRLSKPWNLIVFLGITLVICLITAGLLLLR